MRRFPQSFVRRVNIDGDARIDPSADGQFGRTVGSRDRVRHFGHVSGDWIRVGHGARRTKTEGATWSRLIDAASGAPVAPLRYLDVNNRQESQTITFSAAANRYTTAWVRTYDRVIGQAVDTEGQSARALRHQERHRRQRLRLRLRTDLGQPQLQRRFRDDGDCHGGLVRHRVHQRARCRRNPDPRSVPRDLRADHGEQSAHHRRERGRRAVPGRPQLPPRGAALHVSIRPTPNGNPGPNPPPTPAPAPMTIDLSPQAAPNGSWFLAEGVASSQPFNTFYLVANENPNPVSVRAYFADSDGKVKTTTFDVPARSRHTVDLGASIGTGHLRVGVPVSDAGSGHLRRALRLLRSESRGQHGRHGHEVAESRPGTSPRVRAAANTSPTTSCCSTRRRIRSP